MNDKLVELGVRGTWSCIRCRQINVGETCRNCDDGEKISGTVQSNNP